MGSLLREARIQTEMKLFENSIDLVIFKFHLNAI